jgi:hypothetical protein
MGVLFIEYPNGSRYLSCLKCDCPIANASPDNMTIDSGRRQYLIKKCVNVKIGHSYNKNSDNRHSVHMVRDVGCLKCNQNLGWSNEFIAEPKKQSKEGKISIFCDKICLRNEKDQKISSRRIELPELLFLSGEFELTASDMDTEDDSEDDSDVDLAEDLSLDEIIGHVTHNLSGAARNAAMRGIRDAAVMRGQGRLARLTDREAQDIIDTAEEEMMNRIANRREENRIYQNQINNFRRQLSIREGSL